MIDALPLLLGDDGYQISRSVRIRSSASAFFSRTPASGGSQTTCTWSGWLKRTPGVNQYCFSASIAPSGDNNNVSWFAIGADDTPSIVNFVGGAFQCNIGNANFRMRDPSAWYHVVFQWNTTNATAALRARVWVNNVEVTLSGTQPAQNNTAWFNTTGPHTIGKDARPTQTSFWDGYLTEVNFIDGQALTPAAFGETDAITGVWKPRRYTGTYGTNGFFLNFSDPSAATAAAIGRDYSGNGNNWTPNNISVTAGATYDSMLDVPTPWGDRGNYAVITPLVPSTNTISDGNLRVATSASANAKFVSTIGADSGKYYMEFGAAAWGNSPIGITANTTAQSYLGNADGSTSVSFWPSSSGTQLYVNNVLQTFPGGGGSVTWAATDIAGLALDADNRTVALYKNGVLVGSAYSYSSLWSGTTYFAGGNFVSGLVYTANFGQRPFAYTPPTGFRALNTQNLPEPTIVRGNRFMDVTTYTGTGAAQNIVNSGAMQPDLVWIKSRSVAGSNHELYDAVRGATLFLSSNTTGAEGTLSQALTAFNSNGFALGNGTSSNSNSSGASLVAWQWREGATQGFDIVTWTGTGVGQTISHNLGVAPRLIIPKSRTGTAPTNSWHCYHASLGATRGILLNSTNAAATDSGFWNNTEPTSSVVTLGTYNSYSGQEYVAYLFSEVAGFSRFGSYTGNGSADGPFVFCGFRPRWLLVKNISNGTADAGWVLIDAARSAENVMDDFLQANSAAAESTSSGVNTDFTANGFKIRNVSTAMNASGNTIIFMAFAENPFKYSLAR